MTFRKALLENFDPTQLDGYQEMYENYCNVLAENNKNIISNFYSNGDPEKIKECLHKKSESNKKFYANLDPEEKRARDSKRIIAILNMDELIKINRNLKIKESKSKITKEERIILGKKINEARGWESFEAIKARISRDTLHTYYIKENHSKEDTMNHFNVKDSMLCDLLNYYNIHKFLSKSEVKSKYKELDSKLEEIKHLYLEKNWTQNQLADYYGLKLMTMSNYLSSRNIKKFKKEGNMKNAKV